MQRSPGIPRDARVSNRPSSYIGTLTDFLNESASNKGHDDPLVEEDEGNDESGQVTARDFATGSQSARTPSDERLERFSVVRSQTQDSDSSRTRSFIDRLIDRTSVTSSLFYRKSTPRKASDASSPLGFEVPGSFPSSGSASIPDTPHSATSQFTKLTKRSTGSEEASDVNSKQSKSWKALLTPDKKPRHFKREVSGQSSGPSSEHSDETGATNRSGLRRMASWSPLASKSTPVLPLHLAHEPFDLETISAATEARLKQESSKQTPPEIQRWITDTNVTKTESNRGLRRLKSSMGLGIGFDDLLLTKKTTQSSKIDTTQQLKRQSGNLNLAVKRRSIKQASFWDQMVQDVFNPPSRQGSVKTVLKGDGAGHARDDKEYQALCRMYKEDPYNKQRAVSTPTASQRAESLTQEDLYKLPPSPLPTHSLNEARQKPAKIIKKQQSSPAIGKQYALGKTSLKSSSAVGLATPLPLNIPLPKQIHAARAAAYDRLEGGHQQIPWPSPPNRSAPEVPPSLQVKKRKPAPAGLSIRIPSDHEHIKKILGDDSITPPSPEKKHTINLGEDTIVRTRIDEGDDAKEEMSQGGNDMSESGGNDMSESGGDERSDSRPSDKKKGKAPAKTGSYSDEGSSPGAVTFGGQPVEYNSQTGSMEYVEEHVNASEGMPARVHSVHPAFRDSPTMDDSRPPSHLSITDVMNDWQTATLLADGSTMPGAEPHRRGSDTPDSQETVKPRNRSKPASLLTPDEEIAGPSVDAMAELDRMIQQQLSQQNARERFNVPEDARSYFSDSSEEESPKRSHFLPKRLKSSLAAGRSESFPNLKRMVSGLPSPSSPTKTEEGDKGQKGLLTSSEISAHRVRFGIPVISPHPSGDKSTAHPHHPFDWHSTKLLCARHEGPCPICRRQCCIGATIAASLRLGHAGDAGTARWALEEVAALGRNRSGGVEGWKWMVRCTWCGLRVCPHCAGRCGLGLCGDVACRVCVDEPWEGCMVHADGEE